MPMTDIAPTDADQTPETFLENVPEVARGLRNALIGFLMVCAAFIALALWSGPLPGTFLLVLTLFLLGFSVGASNFLRRIKRNQPLLIIGAEGVTFPDAGFGPIAWDDIEQIHRKTISVKGARFHYVIFKFRDGTPIQRQFGSLGRNRYELMTSTGRTLFSRGRDRILGGTDRLLQSIRRFHPVETS